MNVTYLSDDKIEEIAEAFLQRYCPEALQTSPITPTPIELIVEKKIKLEIVPFRGYLDRFGIDGSISTGLTNVTVDEHVLERAPNRLHFTLAHEVGHLVLHSDIIRELQADSTLHWREKRLRVPGGLHHRMEIQASQFAGCVLVPMNPLKASFEEAKARLAEGADGLQPEELSISSLSWVAGWIAKKFNVSTAVVEIRMKKLLL